MHRKQTDVAMQKGASNEGNLSPRYAHSSMHHNFSLTLQILDWLDRRHPITIFSTGVARAILGYTKGQVE